ncbi:MAG: rod shape-determining protein MreC [Candidatus Sungiibacteriota bacterium]
MTPKDRKSIELLVFVVTAGLLIFLSIVGGLGTVTNLFSRGVAVPLLSSASRIFWNGGDYQAIQNENIQLKSQVAEADFLKKENDILRKALGLGYEEGRRVIPVSNVGFYRFFENEIVIIDRGIEAGIKAGDAVQTGEKVYVGRVISNDRGRADVLLVTSRSQAIDISFPNLNVRARARGVNGRELAVDFVPDSAAIQKGNLFTVTRKPGNTSSGLLLGEIREVATDESKVFKIIRAIHLFDPFGAEPLFVMPSGSPN